MSAIRRTLGVARKTLSILRHDKRTLAFIIAVPLLMIVIFGYTFGGEPKNLGMAVYNADQMPEGFAQNPNASELQPMGDMILENVNQEYFDWKEKNTRDKAIENVEEGVAWGALILPQNFTQSVMAAVMTGDQVHLELYMDGTNSQITSVILQELSSSLQETMKAYAQAMGMPVEEPAVNLTVDYIYGGDQVEFIDNLAPGIIGYAVMMVTLMITLITLVRERNDGTLERAFTTPLNPFEIVLGNAVAFSVVALVQSLVVFGAALLLFDITVMGSVFLVMVVLMLLGIGHQGLGILLSAAAKNELQAIQMFPLIVFPSLLVTGMLWPIESIPEILQPLSHVVPLTYAIDALKGIMLKGWGIGDIWFQLVFMSGFAVLTLVLAGLFLKKKG